MTCSSCRFLHLEMLPFRLLRTNALYNVIQNKFSATFLSDLDFLNIVNLCTKLALKTYFIVKIAASTGHAFELK